MGARDTVSFVFGSDINHMRLAAGVEMSEFFQYALKLSLLIQKTAVEPPMNADEHRKIKAVQWFTPITHKVNE